MVGVRGLGLFCMERGTLKTSGEKILRRCGRVRGVGE